MQLFSHSVHTRCGEYVHFIEQKALREIAPDKSIEVIRKPYIRLFLSIKSWFLFLSIRLVLWLLLWLLLLGLFFHLFSRLFNIRVCFIKQTENNKRIKWNGKQLLMYWLRKSSRIVVLLEMNICDRDRIWVKTMILRLLLYIYFVFWLWRSIICLFFSSIQWNIFFARNIRAIRHFSTKAHKFLCTHGVSNEFRHEMDFYRVKRYDIIINTLPQSFHFDSNFHNVQVHFIVYLWHATNAC